MVCYCIRMHNAKVPSKSERIFVAAKYNHGEMYRQIFECPNVCMQNQKELLKIDMFFSETFLFFKLILSITCKLFCIFTVSKCQ